MAKIARKTTHHRPPEPAKMPPMGVVIERIDSRSLLYQIVIPFAVATLFGVSVFAGVVHIYRTSSYNLKPKAAKKSVPVLPPKGNADDIRHSLQTVASLYVAPMDLITLIQDESTSYTLVDVRASAQFEKAHIKTAVNIPDVTRSSIDSIRIYPVILYGESPYAQGTLQAAKAFSSAGKDVRMLSVSWNEFRFFPNLWMPEDWWNRVQVDDYLQVAESN